MIQVNDCSVSNDNKSINIDAITDEGYKFTSIRIWTDKTFKVLSKAFVAPISGVNNKEILIVSAQDMGLQRFDGIYFVEFLSDAPGEECDTCPNPVTAVITNLVTYYRCAMEMLLKASRSNLSLFNSETCYPGDANNAMTVNLLIDAINNCIKINRFVDAISLLDKLRVLCSSCSNCIPADDNNNYVDCSSCSETNIFHG